MYTLLLAISVTVIAVIMVVAVVFLIPILLQIRRTSREAEKLLESIRMQIVPLSHDLTSISKEITSILQSIHRQVDKMEAGISTVQDTALRIREFEEEVLGRLEEPLFKLIALFSAVSRGIEAFVRVLRR